MWHATLNSLKITADCGWMAGDRSQSCYNGCMPTAFSCRTMTTSIKGYCISGLFRMFTGTDHSENSNCMNTSDMDLLWLIKNATISIWYLISIVGVGIKSFYLLFFMLYFICHVTADISSTGPVRSHLIFKSYSAAYVLSPQSFNWQEARWFISLNEIKISILSHLPNWD